MTEQPISTDVHAEAFFTADHAVVHAGKLYVNGGFWTRLNFASFPVAHNFSICVVLHVPWHEEQQECSFAIFFEDADGQPTANRVEGHYKIGAAPEMGPGDFTEIPVAVQVNNFVFQRPGDYAAILEVDGEEIRRSRIRAVEAVGGQQAIPPPQVTETHRATALVQRWEDAVAREARKINKS